MPDAVQRAAGPGSDVRVAEVVSRADRRDFLRLPWRIQRGDPAWVPPLLVERAAFVDRRHPFRAHGEAALLLARRGGVPAGRLLVSTDPRFEPLHGERAAFFGLFESERDPAVAGALLDAAAAWARRRALDRLVGPIDYAIHYQSGLLVEGFDTPPRVMQNHNPPWYAGLLEGWGLRKRLDLVAFRLDLAGPDRAPPRLRALASRLAARSGAVVRPVRLADYAAEVERLKAVYNRAWAGTWGFVPMSDAEFAHLAADLRRLVVPDLLALAEVRGEPVGMCLVLPDLNEALRPLDGRLTTLGLPVGLARLLWRLPRVKGVRLVTLGVLPPFRRRGIADLLILHVYDAARRLGYTAGETGWTPEDNGLVTSPSLAFRGEPYKRWRVYARDLAPAGRA